MFLSLAASAGYLDLLKLFARCALHLALTVADSVTEGRRSYDRYKRLVSANREMPAELKLSYGEICQRAAIGLGKPAV